MFNCKSLLSFVLLATIVAAQQAGTLTAETHPKLSWSKCTGTGTSASCTTQAASIVLDANWRWLHTTSGSTNCYTGNAWDTTICPDGATCAQNCALDGADYSGTYGITTSGNALTLKYVTVGPFSTNIGSRVYLMDTADSGYEMFKPNNKEFTFDVDVSNLPCGLNGALYFAEMPSDGGLSKYPTNKAGAKYGTGYCDAQCPHDIKFINGEANVAGWTPSATDPNAGSGTYGTCCPEMDIWEANSISNAYTPHPCSIQGQTRCSGTACGDGKDRYSGYCDKDGCDFNSYRMGNTTFYGSGKTINTKQKMTVVTQFITADGTDTGALKEIRRLYVQNGKVIQNSMSNISGLPATNSLTDASCSAQKTLFKDTNSFQTLGGMASIGAAQSRGMALVMSLWGDHAAHMMWLDSTYPLDAAVTDPGASRGGCSRDSGVPDDLTANSPGASVTFSNIKFGTIGSTYSGSTTSVSTFSTDTRTTATPAPTGAGTGSDHYEQCIPAAPAPSSAGTGSALYGQCGGIGWTGPTTCASGACQVSNPYYSQCLP
ncbi:cellulase [Terfezia boudieri ATCC MYA-4762]|uniref:Glucanase n=1 Tax=Terfezia boudieri ATCC MYA-4762 TaxID=1051890 RepID=A0A3N4LL77_9PEZI|nr:cellulase [Terfezia boudieri ATCC MYA-4762]